MKKVRCRSTYGKSSKGRVVKKSWFVLFSVQLSISGDCHTTMHTGWLVLVRHVLLHLFCHCKFTEQQLYHTKMVAYQILGAEELSWCIIAIKPAITGESGKPFLSWHQEVDQPQSHPSGMFLPIHWGLSLGHKLAAVLPSRPVNQFITRQMLVASWRASLR